MPPGGQLTIVLLITVNCMIELVLTASDFGWVGSPYWRGMAYGYGAFYSHILTDWPDNFWLQPLTIFVSYSFLHAGLTHLIMNMIALAMFGTAILRQVGTWRFLLAYLLCAIGGAFGYLILSSSPSPMVGASGALFGLLGISICWTYLDRRHYGQGLESIAGVLAVLVLYNLLPWLVMHGQLAWETHLGGFVTGWLIALYWGRQTYRRQSRSQV